MTDVQIHTAPAVGAVVDPSLPFPVVGIVGSAGSRQALEAFFRHLPDDSGLAFVVVVQLAAKQQTQLRAALGMRTNMNIVTAADGVALKADHIYLAPPTLQITIADGQLHLQNNERQGARQRLNHFLTSLAADQGQNAVAILLSGTGEDGVQGMSAIKAAGGLTLVQEPDDAAHGALPRRFIATGDGDLSANGGELAQRLVQAKGDLAYAQPALYRTQEENAGEIFAAILTQIATQTGHDLSHCKTSTLYRRIVRRMQMSGLHDLQHYLTYLQNNPSETLALFRDCLVSVTSFFRDGDAYEMLERDCVPQLFLSKGRTDFVRVWVAGCATGEEAYSIAIQLAERAAQAHEPPRIQVFATDLDEEAIAFARRGRYPAAIAKDLAPHRLERYFNKDEHGYVVKPEIREHVLFAVHDLIKDPPFSRLDLICCRNVLIYFNREAQIKVFDIFHYALNPKGYLFLGTSESVDAAPELFGVLNKHCRLYQQRELLTTAQTRAHWRPANALATIGGKGSERAAARRDSKPRTIEELYTMWTLRTHTPPRLLVNENYDITHLFGGAERYLQEREGAITQNILQKVLPDLRLDLRTALYQALNKGERTISRLLHVEIAGKIQLLQLHVGPVNEPGFPTEYVEVVFVEHEDSALLGLGAGGEAIEADLSLVARMEEELVRTRERLQTIIEEYELSSQELKASNEELQSINEELKSTTEELETSKEELQSMNEELVTVNGELTHKIEELHRANSDLLNLVASTDVGALFLDQNLRIKRFTPRAVDLFNLIEGDIGRPFAHLTHHIRHSGLQVLAEHVRSTATRLEETVQSSAGHWYILRLFPYRTVTGEVDGVVITFIDISALKRAESEERQRHQQQSLATLSRQALAGDDLDQLLTAATQQVAQVLEMEMCKVLEVEPGGETLFLRAGVGWQAGLVGTARMPTDGGAQAGYTLRAAAPVVVRDLQTETRFQAPQLLVDHGVHSGMSVTIPGINGDYGVLGVHSRTPRAFATYDVDYLQSVANTLAAAIRRQQTEAALRASEERFRYLIEQASDAIFIADLEGVYTDVNSSACQLLGYRRQELIGQRIVNLVPAGDQAQVLQLREQLLHTSETQTAEWTLLRKDGTGVAVEVSTKILPNGVWQAIARDITERKEAAEEVMRLNRELNRRLSEMQTLLDVAPIGVAVAHDPACAMITINPAGAAMLGTSNAENVSLSSASAILPFRVFQHGQEVPPADLPMQYAATHNVAIQQVEYDIIWANGQVRNLYEYASPLYDEAGAVRGCLGIFVDITDRKLVEQALQASETQLRLVTDNVSGLISYVDREECYRFVNAVYETWFNQPRAKIIGHSVRETLGEAGYAVAQPYLIQALNGQLVTFENTITYADGVTRTVLSTYVPDLNSQGQTLGFYALITDISARKQAEERLHLALEAGRMATWDWDITQDRMVWSEQLAPLLGIARGPFSSTFAEFIALIHPADGPLVQAAIQAALECDADYHLEFRMLRTDQQAIWIEARGRVYRAEAGQPLRMAGMYLDIAQRKLAEEQLRRSEAQFRAVQQATPDGFMIFESIRNPAGTIIDFRWVYTNPAGEAILGRSHEDLVGKQMLIEMPGNREEGLFAAYCRVVESGEVWQREFRYAHEGLDHWFQSTAAKAGDGFAVAFSDVTERKRAEAALQELTVTLEQRVRERTAELERSNHELDQFAYVASHDLKAPLRAIINLASWLAEDAADRLSTSSQEHLNKLRGRAQRMERLLDDLLTYSRIGRRDGTVEQVKLDLLLQDVIYVLAPPPGFAIIIDGELPTLLTPRTPLELIFRNLIGNAIKHHDRPAQGEVHISVQEAGAYLQFAVCDNGPGIEPQYFERIFGMFQVLKPRDEVEGSGMGLALVKKTVEYRGGEIRVEANEGAGVTVYFTWPNGTNS